MFPVSHSALFSCLRKTGDIFTAVRVLVPTNVPRLGDSDLRDFWVKNMLWSSRLVPAFRKDTHPPSSETACFTSTLTTLVPQPTRLQQHHILYDNAHVSLCIPHAQHAVDCKHSSTKFVVDTWLRYTVFQAPAALSHGNSPQCPLSRRLGGLRGQSGRFGDQKSLFPLPGISAHFLRFPALRSNTVKLSYPGCLRQWFSLSL